jgi:hypothetical protein
MFKFARIFIAVIILIALGGGGFMASGTTYDGFKLDFAEPRWQTKYNNLVDAVYGDLGSLSTLITNWAPTENVLTMVPVTATYVDGDTFTLPGDYTTRFPALAVVQARVAAGTVESTVASSSYGAGVTTVNLNNAVLTNPITRIYVFASRNGLFPYGTGEVNALDYAGGTPSQAGLQAAIDAIGISERPLLLPSGLWPISSRLNIPTNINTKISKGAVLTVTIPDVAIADLSRAAACVVSWVGHGMETGDIVYLSGITQAEWVALNGHHLVTKINANSFSIPVNTSAYTVGYVPGTDPGIYSQTLLIAGTLDAGLYQIFSCIGTGKVVFGSGAVKEVYPEWWNGDLAAAYAATPSIVRLTGSAYTLVATLALETGKSIVGPGQNKCNITATGLAGHAFSADTVENWALEGFTVTGDVLSYDGLYVTGCQLGFNVKDVKFTGFTHATYGRGIMVYGKVGSGAYFGNFYGINSTANRVGVRIESTSDYRCNVHRFYGCIFLANVSDGIQLQYTEGINFFGCETEDNGGYGVNMDVVTNFLYSGGWIENNYSGNRNINFTTNSRGSFFEPKCVLGAIYYNGVAVAKADLTAKMRFLFASNSSADVIAYTWYGQVDRAGGTNRAVETHERAAAGQDCFKTQVDGDTVPRFTVNSNGKLTWGAGGAAAQTIGLARYADNILALDAGDTLKLDRVRFNVLTAEPGAPANGDVAYADGTSWNPGSGAGLYVRTGGAWVRLH